LTPPGSITGCSWVKLPLTEKEVDRKRTAISYYKSEIKYDPPYLLTFARKNELYGDYPAIKLKSNPGGVDDGKINWSLRDSNLYIKLNLNKKAEKDAGMIIFLLGYSRKTDFAAMPKIWVSVDAFGIHVRDKRKAVYIKDAGVSYVDNAVILKVPIAALGNPDYILTNVRAAGFSDGKNAWRILELSGN